MTVSAPRDTFELRRRSSGNVIDFYAPGLKRWETTEWKPANARRFLPVSVTGAACALQCDHCQANVLKGMISATGGADLYDLARRLWDQGTDGLLISGGSTRSGGVPLGRHLEAIARIKQDLPMRVVVHSGVVSPEIAEGLAGAGVDGVMLDVIGADETIRDVYHLDLSTADFERSLALLADQGLRIIPHIVIGLHYGRFLGEWNALEMIARYPVSTLILVVLMPLVGTPMAEVEPPPTDEVVDFFALARTAMPDTKINLGCGRPMGETKRELDWGAIDVGLDGIAYPAEGAIAYARERGLEPRLYEFCCSLTWAGEGYQEVTIR